MIKRVKTIANLWIDWYEIVIESDMTRSLPNIDIVWLPDAAIKESKERIRSTFKNCGVDLPPRRIILNLSPSDVKKVWTRFDLPMAVAIFLLLNDIWVDTLALIESSIFIWELGLDGALKSTHGVLTCVLSAIKLWYKNFFIPRANFQEIEYIEWINICPLDNFSEIMSIILWEIKIDFIKWKKYIPSWNKQSDIELNDIKWHYFIKRALMVWVAWLHNILMVWPPWSGKTLLAKAMWSILPPLNFEEILEISQIYSLVGMLTKSLPLIDYRPFRCVHNTASKISIIWWWANLLPWEVSLSHKWILFFDEILEFPRTILESLRQPLEDRVINISRANWSARYPCKFMFVWAMNPCKCGYYKDKEKVCSCSMNDIKKYQSRISWPLYDRFDMVLDVPRQSIDIIMDKTESTNSTDIVSSVHKAWEIQQKRFKDTDIFVNSEMNNKKVDIHVILDIKAEEFLKEAVKILNLSPRLIHRTLKLSRTIADIDWEDVVNKNHIAEALQYRSKNLFI